MTLLMILLLGGIVECISERVSLYPSATLTPERSPDITGDNQLLRVSTLRVPTQKAEPHHEPLLPWFALLSLSFFLYGFIKTGMVSGLLPVMGSPLPFFSYGGTAMITQGVCFGIIMSLCRATSRYD
jgi:hypothetical protein